MTGENDTFQHKSLYVTARYSKLEVFFLKDLRDLYDY